jgi:hypothetical protein
MSETPEQQGGAPPQQPDEVPSDENLDVEGPNESGQPTGAPGLEGNPSDPDDST